MTIQRSVLELIINAVKKGKGLSDAAKETEKLTKEQKRAKKQADLFKTALGSLAVTAGAVAFAFIKQIPELLELDFRFRNAKIALEAYSGSAHEAQEITDAVTRAAGGAIDQFTATQNATRLFSLGLADNAEQAEKLTKVAITLGATMGRDAKTAFEDFTLLLANQSILRLDTFGISAGRVRERMGELIKEFPELDRQTRFLNATLEIADERMAKLEAAGFNATSSMDRFRAEMQNLKLDAARAVSDGLQPMIDTFFEIVDASRDQTQAVFDAAESWEEYQGLLAEANRVGGVFFKNTRFTNEELFNQAKTAELVADEMGGMSQEIDEATKAQLELQEATAENDRLMGLLQISMRGLVGDAVEKLIEAEEDLAEITDKNSDEWERAKEKADELSVSLQRTTAELIFQQAAADLDAETSLRLARALGLVDEATFATAQAAQELRQQYNFGEISADTFTSSAVELSSAIARLKSKNIAITVETLQAELAINRVSQAVRSLPSRTGTGRPMLGRPNRGFQEGGSIILPDKGQLGDRIPVSFMAERGERIDITPRSGDNAGGGQGVNIENVNIGNEIDLAMFVDVLENAR